ncbi:MAG: YncE family protein [Pseudorhodobacter sp.]|nr:YncE family protein [Pseudorhodobacter sp.]
MKRKMMLALLATAASLAAGAALAQTVYIPEGGGNSVLVVDAATGDTIRPIDGLEAVHGLSGAPGVAVLVADSFAEIDRAEAVATEKPAEMAQDQHQAHHAAPAQPIGPTDAGISLLSIIDVKTADILRRIEVPGAVHHTAVSPDGRYAVATHPAGDGISVIDLESYALVAFVPTGPMPNYAVFGADPGVVYVSNTGNGTVSEVDLARGIVRRNLVAGAGPEHLVIDAKAERLYAADADAGRVLELALESGETLRSFEIGGALHGLALTEDGARLIVAGLGEDKLASVDLAAGTVATVALADQPYHVAMVPGTGRLYVSSRAAPKVWIVDARDLSVVGEVSVADIAHQMVALE